MSAPEHVERKMADALRRWIENGEPRGPFSLHLSPTMACNLNCLFCRRKDQMKDYYKTHREIPNERYLRMVDEALDMGVMAVTIKGAGEPLLRRSLIRKLAPLIRSYGAAGDLITNGTHLDENLCQILVACGWDQVTFSLDGADAATHDFLRDQPGTFDRVMAAVKCLGRTKQERRSSWPLLAFHCVVTNRNFENLGTMVEIAHRLGVARVELDSMNVQFESNKELQMGEEHVRRFQELLPGWIKALDDHGLSHNFGNFRSQDYIRRDSNGEDLYSVSLAGGNLMQQIPCYYPWYQASITPSGDIVPCCYAEGSYRSKANLNEVSFREAWLRRDPEEYRLSMKSGAMMPFCRNCTAMYADSNNRMRRLLAEEKTHARA